MDYDYVSFCDDRLPPNLDSRQFIFIFIAPLPPHAVALVAPERRAIEPWIGAPQRVQPAAIGRVSVEDFLSLDPERAHPRQFAQVGPPVHATHCAKGLGGVGGVARDQAVTLIIIVI